MNAVADDPIPLYGRKQARNRPGGWPLANAATAAHQRLALAELLHGPPRRGAAIRELTLLARDVRDEVGRW